MDEESLKASIETYQQQREQVNQAIQAAGETQDLLTLRQDLDELINLTQESLLSLRKSALLKQLDDADHITGNDDSVVSAGSSEAGISNSTIDDEYAAFQAMLGDDVTQTNKGNARQQQSDNLNKSLSDIYADVVGTKCRAPFVQSWGEKTYGNALIVGIEDPLSDDEIPKVRVMFCNPTHQSMLPCKYFLDGECKFTEERCRCSHGYMVSLEELQEYEEPDYSSLKIESKCLACYEDDIWYKATVVDISEDTLTVMFDSYEDEAVPLAVEDVLPIDHVEESSDSEDEQPVTGQDSEDDQDSLPVFLWKPPLHGLGDLGQWEAHTKGIGSKLLTKMGYEPGKGLGKAGEGRVLPVPIQLLPQGKSLDKIMKLKELAGDRDMFDAMKKVEKKMKKQAEQMEKAYEKKEKPDVFDFINTKLRGKKGSLSELLHKHEGQGQKGKGHGHRNHSKTISEHDLHKKSERSINIQLLKTSEEMKSVEKELDRLKQSLNRNENRDKNMASQVRSKIQSLESYRDQLKSSEQTMQTHQKKRSDHRKLTIF